MIIYTVYISVYSPDRLPALFVDGAVKSGSDWNVSENMVFGYCKTAYTVRVGTADLTDPDVLPGDNVFEYKQIFPLSEETIGNKKLYDFGKETFGYVLLDGIKGNTKLSDIEKALLLHDRIAVWCEYTTTKTTSGSYPRESYNAYGVFANSNRLETAL